MRRSKVHILRITAAVFLFLIFAVSIASAEGPYNMKTCWQPEHSTYILWNALEKGWDKEAGLKIDLVYFDSGMAQMEGLPAKQ